MNSLSKNTQIKISGYILAFYAIFALLLFFIVSPFAMILFLIAYPFLVMGALGLWFILRDKL
jgi:hypothetical protein